jgi:hypothetical protein
MEISFERSELILSVGRERGEGGVSGGCDTEAIADGAHPEGSSGPERYGSELNEGQDARNPGGTLARDTTP